MRGERRPSVGTRPDKPGEAGASVPGVEGRSDGVCTVRCLYCSLHIDWSPGHVRRRPPGPGGSCAARRAGHCSGRGGSGQAVGAPSPLSENIWLIYNTVSIKNDMGFIDLNLHKTSQL